MSERILIIGRGVSQQLSSDLMSRFQKVKMLVESNQNLPIEVVSQLLLLQSQLNIKIDFLQLDSNTNEEYNDLLAFQIGLLLSDIDNEIAILTDDIGIDPVIEFGKTNGFKIQRMSAGGTVAQSASQIARPAPAPITPSKPAPQPTPISQPAPTPSVAQPAPQPQTTAQTTDNSASQKKDPNNNKRLISTLIGGSSGLMGR